MRGFTLNRRTILRGAAGAAVTLPPLEIMFARRARAVSSPIPSYFLLANAGVSHGGYNPPDQSIVVPKEHGRGFKMTRGLGPIWGGTVGSGANRASYTSVASDVGLVSGLEIPASEDAASCAPAGRVSGPNGNFHVTTAPPQTAGERTLDNKTLLAKGSTADHLVGAAIGADTPFSSIQLQVQASAYYNSSSSAGWTVSTKNGKEVRPEFQPSKLYGQLFSMGAVDGRTFDAAAFIDRRRSILDAVLDKSTRLAKRLGGEDRMRLEKYYTGIRDLETSLVALKAKGGMACTPPGIPADPPIDNNVQPAAMTGGFASADVGWSDEDLRGKIMCDLVRVAFACNLTRSVLMEILLMGGTMNVAHIVASGRSVDCHGASHGGEGANAEDMADVVAWNVKQFCYLASLLRDTSDGLGGRLLDHTAMSMIFEGGNGNSPSSEGPHCTHDMIVVVAGSAGGLKSAQNINFGNKAHPGQVVLTHMNAVGVPVEHPFGDLTGQHLSEMFT